MTTQNERLAEPATFFDQLYGLCITGAGTECGL